MPTSDVGYDGERQVKAGRTEGRVTSFTAMEKKQLREKWVWGSRN